MALGCEMDMAASVREEMFGSGTVASSSCRLRLAM